MPLKLDLSFIKRPVGVSPSVESGAGGTENSRRRFLFSRKIRALETQLFENHS